jgi:hypothetical protein
MWQGGMNPINDDHLNFISNSLSNNTPANMIIMLDANVDAWNGKLQITGGFSGTSTTLTLADVVSNYMGDHVLKGMSQSSATARSYDMIPELDGGGVPYADIAPKVHGGWWVIVMVTGGSAIRQPAQWGYITKVIEKYVVASGKKVKKLT